MTACNGNAMSNLQCRPGVAGMMHPLKGQCRQLSLTEVIRTCLKDRIFGTFWFVVLERRQPSVVLRAKIYSKIQPLRSENFKREDF